MKRIKAERHLGTDGKWKRVLDESDYRKVMAVYNAAMKWQAIRASTGAPNTQHYLLLTDNLQKACERSRK